MPELSIVRNNLLTRPGYSPYCGNESCCGRMPRTQYWEYSKQFQCSACGWESQYPADFIERYEAYRKTWIGTVTKEGRL